ncbi:hypothetical protein DFH29DRAFT_1056274 [Suillus ampliporus]|nr:hypothetical protein DFH29DRAFT_1056274 [Suillus ampliporus]
MSRLMIPSTDNALKLTHSRISMSPRGCKKDTCAAYGGEQGGGEMWTRTWGGEQKVPGDKGQISGLVGLFYTSLVDSKFLVLGAPAESKVVSSFNAIIQATEPQPPSNPKIHGYFDPRRIVTVNQIATDQALHVAIPAASVNSSSPGITENVALGPGPVRHPPGPSGGHQGPGPEKHPHPETIPGHGKSGAPHVVIRGEITGKD